MTLCVCPRLLWIQLVGVLGNGYSYGYWLDLRRLLGDWLNISQKRKGERVDDLSVGGWRERVTRSQLVTAGIEVTTCPMD